MSRLDDLIAELCPNGVEYRRLKDIVSIERGTRVVRSQLSASEGYPVYQNSLTPMGYHSERNYPPKTAFIIAAGAAGEIGFSEEPFWAADDCYCLVCGQEINSRFLYHNLLMQKPFLLSKVRKASIPRLGRNIIENLSVPVPPMEIQREIVRILDNFTELTARKKQYEYYRDQLLDFGKIGGWYPELNLVICLSLGMA